MLISRAGIAALFFGLTLFSGAAQAFVFSVGQSNAISDDHLKYAQSLVSEFRIAYPNASITLDETDSYIKPVVETIMYSNMEGVPDVAIAGLTAWPILYERKLLNPLMAVLTQTELAKIRQNVRPELGVQYYGSATDYSLYSLPFNSSQPVLYVNTELLKASGPSLTWEELFNRLATDRKRVGDRVKRFKILIPREDWFAEQILLNANGESTLDSRGVHLVGPKTVEVLKQLKRLSNEGFLEITQSQHEAYQEFLAGTAAGVLLSYASYNSIINKSRFAVVAMQPPKLENNVVVAGGGDLVLPLNPSKKMSESKKHDIHDFLLWFYAGKGAAVWSDLVGYPPVTKSALVSASFKKRLKERAVDRDLLTNSQHWALKSFFRIDRYCNIGKLGSVLAGAVFGSVAETNLSQWLSASQQALNDAYRQPCVSP